MRDRLILKMVTKKAGFILLVSFALALFIISISFTAANLELKKEIVSSYAIQDLNLPAIVNLDITNLGATDNFRIYSLTDVRIEPTENFSIATGETKRIVMKIYPDYTMKNLPNYYSFIYNIKGDLSGIREDNLAITIVDLRDAFSFTIDNINPDSSKAVIHFENKGGHSFSSVNMKISSEFFNYEFTTPLNAYEKKEYQVALDKVKMASLFAGPYIVNAELTVNNLTTQTSTTLKFEEKPGIESSESYSGFLSKVYEVEKFNKGNIKTEVTVIVKKDLFSALFTSINIPATKKERTGFTMNYIFTKELSPGERLDVVAKTNWWILVLIVVVVIVVYYAFDKYLRNKLVLKKTVHFVRTKGGEFALKVTVHLKARDYVEKIRLIDRLPPMVKVFEKYGILPEKTDEKNRRMEWSITSLSRGEERTVSYIIYSSVGVLGRFELPRAEAFYEYAGKVKEASSNRAFYVNEPGLR